MATIIREERLCRSRDGKTYLLDYWIQSDVTLAIGTSQPCFTVFAQESVIEAGPDGYPISKILNTRQHPAYTPASADNLLNFQVNDKRMRGWGETELTTDAIIEAMTPPAPPPTPLTEAEENALRQEVTQAFQEDITPLIP